MKYLALLFLVSCVSTPTCTVKESGVILNRTFTILECSRRIDNYDSVPREAYILATYCLSEKQNDKFICFIRN